MNTRNYLCNDMLLNRFRKTRTHNKRKRTNKNYPEDPGAATIRIRKRPNTATVEQKIDLKELIKVSKQAVDIISTVMVDKGPLTPDSPSFNEFKTEPTHIPLHTYIKRVLGLTKSEPQCALIAVVYLQRLFKEYPAFEISQINVRRLMFTAMMISSKMIQDIPYSNKYWSTISGTYTQVQVNKMEIDMLSLMNWNTIVDKEELDQLVSTTQ